jgi:hypothetical protein
MALELNTLAPKKWVANYGGIAPTIDIDDGVRVGDWAHDNSTTPYATWKCLYNTSGSPTWRRYVGAWDDLLVSGLAVKTIGASAPDLVNFAGSTTLQLYGFDGATTTEEVFATFQMPHGWIGSAIYPHVHWSPINANAGTVRWNFEYTWTDIGQTFGGTTTINATSNTSTTAWKHEITSLGTLTPLATQDGISSILVCRLFRDPSLDTYASDAVLLYLDIHYQKDGLGSDAEFTKS